MRRCHTVAASETQIARLRRAAEYVDVIRSEFPMVSRAMQETVNDPHATSQAAADAHVSEGYIVARRLSQVEAATEAKHFCRSGFAAVRAFFAAGILPRWGAMKTCQEAPSPG